MGGRADKNGANVTDPLVVRTKELAAIIQEWSALYRLDHPYIENDHFDKKGRGVQEMGAFDYIGVHSGMSSSVIRNVMRQITEFTEFRKAEKILLAIDRFDALTNGEIHVIPNPRWSVYKWVMFMSERGCI